MLSPIIIIVIAVVMLLLLLLNFFVAHLSKAFSLSIPSQHFSFVYIMFLWIAFWLFAGKKNIVYKYIE